MTRFQCVLVISCFWLTTSSRGSDQPLGGKNTPTDWIDPATGHRVIRLSPDSGGSSLYFHQNAYSADGRKLIVTTPTGLSTIDLKTREIDQVVSGRIGVLVTGRKTGNVYYTRDGAVFATDLESHATREVAKVPGGARLSSSAEAIWIVT